MKVTILNAATRTDATASIALSCLDIALGDRGAAVEVFDLDTLNISPCRSCGSCGIRTPGECVIKDDIGPVLRSMAYSELWVFLTPVSFGGYCSTLKKAIDRMMTLGLPLYFVRDGHLLHPTRYGNTTALLGIGVLDKVSPGEADSFRALVARNGLNMLVKHSALTLTAGMGVQDAGVALLQALQEVGL